MIDTGVYRYVLFVYKEANRLAGVLMKKPCVLYSRKELGAGTDSNEIIPLYDSSVDTVSFDLCSVLDEFFSFGEMICGKLPEPLMYHSVNVKLASGWRDNLLFNACMTFNSDEWYAHHIWGIANEIAEKTDGLKCSLASLDRFRMSYRVALHYSVDYLPDSLIPAHARLLKSSMPEDIPSYRYTCANGKEILFSILHYCISSNYRLKRCRFCGKFFVPRAPQEKFCSRAYEYSNWQGIKKGYPSCKYARESISDTCSERRKTIRRRLYDRNAEYGMLENDPASADFFEFERKDSEYFEKVKAEPSAENLRQYEHFLFLECEKYCQRYRRRK